jgi:hypothetical protein
MLSLTAIIVVGVVFFVLTWLCYPFPGLRKCHCGCAKRSGK